MHPDIILSNARAVYRQFMNAPCDRLADDLYDRHVLLLCQYCDLTGKPMAEVANHRNLIWGD